jgi:DNA polymerase elongation subunit (family B)
MSWLHGKTLTYDEFTKKLMPGRDSFIDSSKSDKKIKRKAPLLFLPTIVSEFTGKSLVHGKFEYRLALTGILRDGTKQTVVITGIYPHFEIKVPKFIDGLPAEPLTLDDQQINTRQQFNSLVNDILENRLFTEFKEAKAEDEPANDKKEDYHNRKYFKIKSRENVKAKTFLGFSREPSDWIRLKFRTANQRLAAIKIFQEAGFETATDDLSKSYSWVAARNAGISLCTWSYLNNYEVFRTDDRVPGEYIAPIHTGDCRPKNKRLIFLNINDFVTYEGEIEIDLIREKTISCCWDIETFSETKTSEIPLPSRDEDRIFCIGMTFQFSMAEDHLFKIAICDMPAKPHPDFLTVTCGNEHNIIKVFIKLLGKISPDFIVGFNDSDYDWRWLANRIQDHHGKEYNLFAQFFAEMAIFYPYRIQEKIENDRHYLFKNFFERQWKQVKIDPTISANCKIVNFDSFIPIDVRTMLRKLYKTDEQSSLKWFLAKFNLGSKYDMPYRKMFNIYQRLVEENGMGVKSECTCCQELKVHISSREVDELEDFGCTDDDPCFVDLEYGMAEINMYCVQDAACCHRLLTVRNIVPDSRESSALVHCPLFDAFYRADSAKVLNKTIAVAQQHPFNLLFTRNVHNQFTGAKFPGAYVHPPEKGLQATKLSLKERWHKANPSKYENPESVPDKKLVEEGWSIRKCKKLIAEHGPCLSASEIKTLEEEYETEFPTALKKFWQEKIGRPISGLDFSSLYPSIIRAYNFSAEYCIRDEAEAKAFEKETGQKLTEVDFIYGNRRVRAWFVWHNNKLDPDDPDFQFGIYGYILDTLFQKRAAIKKRLKKLVEIIEKVNSGDKEKPDDFDFIKVQAAYLDSKQGALKVFMNTFYGTAGSVTSPLFMVEVSGGVTQYGKINIKKAKRFVEERGCHVYYGDTDSLYLSTPEKFFRDADIDFYARDTSKLEYWTKLVQITFKQIEVIREQVNEMFIRDSQTGFLKMAYEEVLFPSMFAAKKKYYGTPHLGLVNFNAKPFVRGFEVKKRGTTNLLKTVFNRILRTSLSLENLRSIEELVLAGIEEVYHSDWKYEDFVATAVYRPSKDNKAVVRFVERMEERGKTVAPNDRFNYVVVKKYPFKYDYRGRKTTLLIGDRWEYASYAEEEKLPIDLDYYMEGSVVGQLARLMTYHPRFEKSISSDLPLEERETRIYALAKKWVTARASKYFSKYNQFGSVLQNAFRKVKSEIEKSLRDDDPFGCALLTANIRGDKSSERSEFTPQLLKMAEREAKKIAKGFGEGVVRRNGKNKKAIDRMLRIYVGEERNDLGLYDTTMMMLDKKRSEILRKLYDVAETSLHHISEYQSELAKAISPTHRVLETNDLESKTGEATKFTAKDIDIGNEIDEAKQNAVEVTRTFLEDRKEVVEKIKEVYVELLACEVRAKEMEDLMECMHSTAAGDKPGTRRPKSLPPCKTMVKIERESTSIEELMAFDL